MCRLRRLPIRPLPVHSPTRCRVRVHRINSVSMTSQQHSASRTQQVDIDLGDRSYGILIGAGGLDASESYAGLPRAASAMIVTNSTVAPLYRDRLVDVLKPAYASI